MASSSAANLGIALDHGNLLSLTEMTSKEIRQCLCRLMQKYIGREGILARQSSFQLLREGFKILEWKIKKESGMFTFF